MHRQGVTRNILIYFQSPPSRLHPCSDGAPSTDNRLRSLSNELALDTWSHMSSKRCQKYSLIFAVPYIVAALILLRSAINRHSREIIILWTCIVFMEFNTINAVPAMCNDISPALYWGSIEFPPQRHLPVSEWNIWVFGVMHRQGVTRNIHIYFQSPSS